MMSRKPGAAGKSAGLSNILASEGRAPLSGRTPGKGTHGAGIAAPSQPCPPISSPRMEAATHAANEGPFRFHALPGMLILLYFYIICLLAAGRFRLCRGGKRAWRPPFAIFRAASLSFFWNKNRILCQRDRLACAKPCFSAPLSRKQRCFPSCGILCVSPGLFPFCCCLHATAAGRLSGLTSLSGGSGQHGLQRYPPHHRKPGKILDNPTPADIK